MGELLCVVDCACLHGGDFLAHYGRCFSAGDRHDDALVADRNNLPGTSRRAGGGARRDPAAAWLPSELGDLRYVMDYRRRVRVRR